MNILVISRLYPKPHDPAYGAFVHQQIKGVQELGHQVVVLSPVPWSPPILHFNSKWHNYSLTPNQTVWDEVEVYYPRYLRLPGAGFRAVAGVTIFLAVWSMVTRLHARQPFDIIYSNTILPDGLTGVYLGQKLKIPTVCMVRGNDIITEPHENSINRYFSKQVIGRTGQMVSVSRALKQLVEQFTMPAKTVRVVYNGVDAEKFRLSGIGEQPQIVSLKPYLLFVGRDIYRKGLRDLMIAFAQLVDKVEHNLVVIGPTQKEVQALEPEKTKLLGNRLTVTGLLTPAEIPGYMANCEALILPSYEEGLPNVVLEAMACGKPVIATKIMGIPEAVINNDTGLLIQPGAPSALAEAIQSLVNRPGWARQMGEQGRQRVVKEFSWARNALEMSSIYQETVSNGTKI